MQKKFISLVLVTSIFLMPLSTLSAAPTYAQNTYDFEEIYDFDISEDEIDVWGDYEIYNIEQPPLPPILSEPVATTSTSAGLQVEYDFSDEAQAKFEAQQVYSQNQQTVSTPLSKETAPKNKNKKKKKKNKQSQLPVETVSEHSSVIPVQAQTSAVSETQQQGQLQGKVVYVPVGASFDAILQSSISSASLSKGDTIAAVLQNDWYHNGILIAPQGSIVYGSAVEAEKASGGYGNGSFAITFNELLTPNGDKLLMASNVVEVVVAGQRWWKVALNVIGGALVGAVLLSSVGQRDNKISTGTIIGAGIGGALGAARAASVKGEEVEIPSGTIINVRLTQPMNVQPYVADEYYDE